MKNTYLYNVNRVLSHIGLAQDTYNWCLVTKKMTENFEKKWSVILNKNEENNFEGNKLRFYRICKDKFIYEEYLNEIKNPTQRAAITRLRTSTHKLLIETGRHNNTPVELRLCQQCDLGQVEDEIHVIFSCTKYNNLRKQLIQKCSSETGQFQSLDSIQKIYHIFNSSHTILKEMGSFIGGVFDARS